MDYITKTEKEQDKFSTGMQRCSQKNKIRYDLIIPLDMKTNMLDRWAGLMARGMAVYGERNWELASTQEELDRFRASAFRHFIQWFKGETEEDHAAAILFNVQGAEFVKEKLENREKEPVGYTSNTDYIFYGAGITNKAHWILRGC